MRRRDPRASCALVLWNQKDFTERLREKGEKVPKDGMNSVSACLDKRWGRGSVCSLLGGKVNRLQRESTGPVSFLDALFCGPLFFHSELEKMLQ